MNKKTVVDIDLNGQCVLMRVDFNVPLGPDGRVADDTRIRKVLPTIEYVLDQKACLIMMSHLGRPKGNVIPELSLKPVSERLSELLNRDVTFVDDCVGEEVEKAASKLESGDLLLLENLRFHQEETDNDPDFAKQLAKLGSVFVNDAFGAAHRAHASTEGVTRFFEQNTAGLLMDKEINYLSKVVESPERPFIAILGGAKISGKIEVIQNLLPKVDALLIGGGMAFTFLKAKGLEIGKSIVEQDKINLAKSIIKEAESKNRRLILPVDFICVNDLNSPESGKILAADQMLPDSIGVDIGAKTVELFSENLYSAKTVIWNGPMGIFENPEFAEGTFEVARLLASITENGAVTIVGGGDSVAAVNRSGLQNKITHLSTGGGASLELLSGYDLPGLTALSDKDPVR